MNTFEYFNNPEEIKITYYLTEQCEKYGSYGKTYLKNLNSIIEFDENDFKNFYNIYKLFNIKLEYSDNRHSKCDYNKKGSLLLNNSIKT